MGVRNRAGNMSLGKPSMGRNGWDAQWAADTLITQRSQAEKEYRR